MRLVVILCKVLGILGLTYSQRCLLAILEVDRQEAEVNRQEAEVDLQEDLQVEAEVVSAKCLLATLEEEDTLQGLVLKSTACRR